MLKQFYPKEDWKSAYEEKEYERLYAKGFRGIIFDIDNTMVEHGAPVNEKAIFLIRKLKNMGFKVCFVSNNKEPRVKSFSTPLGAEYVYKAGKPGAAGYETAMKKMGTTKAQTLSVGDQLFTDMWGANRAGIYSVLVKPISKKEEIQIVLKRYLEKPILCAYRKNKKKVH